MKLTAELGAELRRAYLFAELSDAHLTLLLEDTRELALAGGETLFRHGQPAAHFYYVRTGLVKLFRLSPEGDEKIIDVIRPGESFAEAIMFMGTQNRYPVNAEAVSDARLLAFDHRPFLELLRATPEASFALLASMSRRLHMLVNQIESLTLQNASYRLVAYLLEQLPGGPATAPEIQLTVPKSVIAAHLAIQPETLSRILARLRQDGLLEVHGAHIAVRDLEALRKLVHRPPETVSL